MARFSFYHTTRWRKLRELIINRDNGMCVHCGQRGDTVHHKEWINNSNYNNDNVIYNPDNLELVCSDCHAKIHNPSANAFADGIFINDSGEVCYMENTPSPK